MRCAMCKKEGDEVQLFEGIHNAEMIMVCEACAEEEKIPLIRKPTNQQIERSQKTYSVRERMERMSGMGKTTPLSYDQEVVQGNLAKLKVPSPKQTHPDVQDNYYWQVNMGRRRKKLTITQMAVETGFSVEVIRDIEKGRIPKDFEEVFLKLEKYLGVKLLKHHKPKVVMHRRNPDRERDILESVKEKMDGDDGKDFVEDFADDEVVSEEDVQDSIRKGKIDFSKRENLKDITLNDLVERKKHKEKKAKEKKESKKKEALLGDDIDLDLEIE